MTPFTHRRTLTISPVPLGVSKPTWKVPRSKNYRLIVADDGMSAVIEFNKGTPLPKITVAADVEPDDKTISLQLNS